VGSQHRRVIQSNTQMLVSPCRLAAYHDERALRAADRERGLRSLAARRGVDETHVSEANGARGSTGVASTGGCLGGAAGTGAGGRPASDTGTESSPAHLTISPANASTVNTAAATAPTTVHLLAENR